MPNFIYFSKKLIHILQSQENVVYNFIRPRIDQMKNLL